MPARLKVYYTSAARLDDLEIERGQLIFVSDMKRLYLDMNGTRICYDNIVTFGTEEDRESYQYPEEGFYFVTETSIMWYYSDGWFPINAKPDEVFLFGDPSSFPLEGSPDKLYISDDAIYRYDVNTSSYVIVSTKQQWGTL
jgi:hypothetical protein